MDLEKEYVEYVIEFSLAMFAASAAYFFRPSELVTWGTLLLIPLLYGYTAYISRDTFKTSSLLSLIALMFIPINTVMAGIAISIGVGNVLVSFFASGESFKDYYGATMIPLLLTGVILGGTFYYGAQLNADLGDNVRDTVAETAGSQASVILEETQLIETQKQANVQMVDQVSQGTVLLTQQYVLNETQGQLDSSDQQALQSAFQSASIDIPEEMAQQAREQQNEQAKTIDIGQRTSDTLRNLLEGDGILLLVPLIAIGFYSVHPVVGLLTAISASVFSIIGKEEE